MSSSTLALTSRSEAVTAGDNTNAASGSGTGTWRSNAVAIVSRTVIDGNSRASWNDRPRPASARWSGDSSVTSLPPSSTRPVESGTKPEMMSRMVVLPAPFGPIIPMIWPLVNAEAHVVDGADTAERQPISRSSIATSCV